MVQHALDSLPRDLELKFQEEVEQYEEERNVPYMTSIERLACEKSFLKGIEVFLDFRFGEEGLKLLPEIREIHDPEKLESILRAIKTTDTPEALRKLWRGENGSQG